MKKIKQKSKEFKDTWSRDKTSNKGLVMSKMLELAYRDSEVAVNNVVKCIVEMGLAYRNV